MKSLTTTAFLAASLSLASAHDHFAVGVIDSNNNGTIEEGEPLGFVGPSGTDRTFHLLPRPLGFRPTQRCGGFYMLDEFPRTLFPNDAFSITAHSNGEYAIAHPKHALTGSQVWAEIVSVSGPPGARFGFWDENQSVFSDTPTHNLETNQPTGNPSFQISESSGDPEEDPHGHIHGRSWTADTPGDYRIGLRFFDASSNGSTGGPLHSPSQIYIYQFKAGPEFKPTITRLPNSVTLTWPSLMGTWDETSQPGITFTIQRSPDMKPGTWENIGQVTATTAATATFTDPSPPPNAAFYRLSYVWAPEEE